MADYKFVTYWEINAPINEVWDLIQDVKKWPDWWHGVLEVHEISNENNSDGNTVFAHTWRSILPYKLKFVTEISGIEYFKTIEANVTGELEGTGKWKFFEKGKMNTTVIYYWHVRTTLNWMNRLAPLLKGVFRWNHNTVMRWGGEGLAKKINCGVVFSSEQRD